MVHSKNRTFDVSGCRPCQTPRCEIFAYVETTNLVTSANSDFSFKITGNLNCGTRTVIYPLRCKLCNLDYIGQTSTSFWLRFNIHKSHVKSLATLSFSKHMNLKEHSIEKIRIILLESGFSSDHDRELKEAFFIHKFNSVACGINASPGVLTWLPRSV